MSDEADIRKSLEGDGEAFNRIVERHQGWVSLQMWRFTRDRAMLEELVQDVFVQAYFGLPNYKAEGPFEHWLRKIAVRRGYRHIRFLEKTRNSCENTVDPESVDRVAHEPNAENDSRWAADLLSGLMGKLSARDRVVLTLVHLDGQSVKDAAELLGWSESMVKVQTHRARGRLKDLLERGEHGRNGTEA